MSQLYYLKRGGIGHYVDVWEEDFIIDHETWSIKKLIELTGQFLTRKFYKDEVHCEGLLEKAIVKFWEGEL